MYILLLIAHITSVSHKKLNDRLSELEEIYLYATHITDSIYKNMDAKENIALEKQMKDYVRQLHKQFRMFLDKLYQFKNTNNTNAIINEIDLQKKLCKQAKIKIENIIRQTEKHDNLLMRALNDFDQYDETVLSREAMQVKVLLQNVINVLKRLKVNNKK